MHWNGERENNITSMKVETRKKLIINVWKNGVISLDYDMYY